MEVVFSFVHLKFIPTLMTLRVHENKIFSHLNCIILVQHCWFDLSLNFCGHKPACFPYSYQKSFITVAVYLTTTGKLGEDSCRRMKERVRHGNKKINSLTFCFCQFPAVAPPSLAFSFPLSPSALCRTNPFWRDK